MTSKYLKPLQWRHLLAAHDSTFDLISMLYWTIDRGKWLYFCWTDQYVYHAEHPLLPQRETMGSYFFKAVSVIIYKKTQKNNSQGAKKIIFTACHLGKLKLAFTSPGIISTSPKSFLTSRIDFTVLLLFKLLMKHHLPVGQVKNRIH